MLLGGGVRGEEPIESFPCVWFFEGYKKSSLSGRTGDEDSGVEIEDSDVIGSFLGTGIALSFARK